MNLSKFAKFVAAGLGIALCAVEAWLNAEHIAHAEGWASSMVAATIAASISAAAVLPLAERAWKAGQGFKAVVLIFFFALMVAFSLGASAGRVGGKLDGEIAAAQGDNVKAQLAQEAYKDAKKAASDACTEKTRGSTACNKATKRLDAARAAALTAPTIKVEDSGGERIAALLRIDKATVQTYQPLALPLALQLGGFILLALGLAPNRPEPDIWAESYPADTEAPAVTNEEAALNWLRGQILKAPRRKLDVSGRAQADTLGIAPATYASWVKKWVAEGKITKERDGNRTIFGLPSVRRVA